jgi:hypothetical protein
LHSINTSSFFFDSHLLTCPTHLWPSSGTLLAGAQPGATADLLPTAGSTTWTVPTSTPVSERVRQIILKLAFDGAEMSKGKRKKQELATFELICDGIAQSVLCACLCANG